MPLVDPHTEELAEPWAGVQVTSRCLSMEVRPDLSLSTEVSSSMTLPARRRTGGPVKLDEGFGLTHRFPGVPWARQTPLRPIRVPDRARHHRPLGPVGHGTESDLVTANLPDQRAGGARLHALHGRHGGQEPKPSQAVAGVGVDRVGNQPLISPGLHERNRTRQAVRGTGVGATPKAQR